MGTVEPLLDLPGLSEYLNVPIRTLYHWRVKGSGPPAYMVGRQLRFRRGEVDAWLEKRADAALVGGS